jgi:hypothetical protein
MKKRGQQIMGMPFGVIFAIFLIVVFFVVAFYAVRNFLYIPDATKTGYFYNGLQDKVNNLMKGQGTDTYKIDLPKKIEKICFANLSAQITANRPEYEQIKYYDIYSNVFLVPPEKAPNNMESKKINNINITRITEKQNPYCITAHGEISLSRDIYDRSVTIK